MANDMTMIADLVNPEVLAPILSYELKHKFRFTPVADVDNTLRTKPGDTLTMPAFTYMGAAADVPEGTAIPLHKLGTTQKQVKVKKIGTGTQITDEAILSGYGDPVKEATKQMATALADKVDDDILAVAKAGTQTVSMAPTVDGVQAGLDIFNDEDDNQIVLFVSPKTAALLRKDAAQQKIGSEIGANQLINGTYADILGAQVIRAKKLADTEAIFVKQGALKLIMKRDVLVENERQTLTQSTLLTATEHYATYLFDETKVVVGTVTAPSTTRSTKNS